MELILDRIKAIFKKEFGFTEENYSELDGEIKAVVFYSIVVFVVEKGKLLISFYSGTEPFLVVQIIQCLYNNNIKEVEVMQNVYDDIKDGEVVGMLFGEEADDRYYQEVYEEMKEKDDNNN